MQRIPAVLLMVLFTSFALCPASATAASEALPTIPALDVPKYLGRWYEIAKFPNWFQRNCRADTSAEYSLMPNGHLQVVNQCRRDTGLMDQARGEARQIGATTSSRLEVRFAPAWLSALPFVWGDYWVVDLDDAYTLSAVSDPARKYLWILSRTPEVDEARYNALLGRLTALGLDVGRLEKTPQRKP